MRALLILGAIVLASCADLRQPAVDGDVHSISTADVRTICAAVDDLFTQEHWEKQPVFWIHVVDRNKVRAYYGIHFGSRPPVSIEHFVEVERIKGKWKAGEAVLQGPMNP